MDGQAWALPSGLLDTPEGTPLVRTRQLPAPTQLQNRPLPLPGSTRPPWNVPRSSVSFGNTIWTRQNTIDTSRAAPLATSTLASPPGLSMSLLTRPFTPEVNNNSNNVFFPQRLPSFTQPMTAYNTYTMEPETAQSHHSSSPERIGPISPKTKAKSLADIIRSGLLEEKPQAKSNGNSNYTSRRAFSLEHSEITESSTNYDTTGNNSDDGIFGQSIDMNASTGSEEFKELLSLPTLTFQDLIINDRVPLTCRVQEAKPHTHGVIKITNVLYNVTKNEITAAIGEKAELCSMPPRSGSYAIHIGFDRYTAKSGDVYVEFPTPSMAESFLWRLRNHRHDSHHDFASMASEYNTRPVTRKIGDRIATFEVSSQPDLMRELFPKAKSVEWIGQVPQIKQVQDSFGAFKSFVTSEEMVSTTKFAAEPKKSRYTGSHAQRPYESMISLLYKFPWYSTHLYTLADRNLLYTHTTKLIISLLNHLRRPSGFTAHLTPSLLQDLLDAAIACPGFSLLQQHTLTTLCAPHGISPRFPPWEGAKTWPFETLSPKEGGDENMLAWYLDLLVLAAEPMTLAARANGGPGVGGIFNVVVPFPVDENEKGKMTMQQACEVEWAYVGALLERGVGIKNVLGKRG